MLNKVAIVSIRLTSSQARQIKSAARRAKLRPSQWVRNLLDAGLARTNKGKK